MAEVHISQSGNLTALKVYASASEQSSSGNYRTIYLNVWAEPKDGYSGGRDADWTFEYVDAYGNSKELYSPSTTVITSSMSIFSGTIVMYVEAGQTSSYPDISFTAQFYSSTLGAYRKVSGSIDEISGLSLVANSSISSVKDVYFGDPCQVVWTPASSSFHYKLTFSIGSDSYTTDVISPGQNTAYTYSSFDIPLEWAANIPNSISGLVRVTLTQYETSSAATTIGSPSSSSFKVTLRDDVIPSVDSCLVQLYNEKDSILDSWGIALAGYTRLSLIMGASGVYGSKITGYNISGDYTVSLTCSSDDGSLSYTGPIIATYGNKQFKITCTDSRGRLSDVFISEMKHVYPYTAPRIKKLSIFKDANDDNDPSDDCLTALCLWEYDAINVEKDGVVKSLNSSIATLYYKTSIDSDWAQFNEEILNNQNCPLTGLSLDESISYNFRLVVTDALGKKSEKEAFSSVKTVLMDFQAGGKGLGIGKICQIDNSKKTAGSLEVSMDSYFWGNMQILGDATLIIGKEIYGTADPNVKFAGVTVPPGQIYFKKVTS